MDRVTSDARGAKRVISPTCVWPSRSVTVTAAEEGANTRSDGMTSLELPSGIQLADNPEGRGALFLAAVAAGSRRLGGAGLRRRRLERVVDALADEHATRFERLVPAKSEVAPDQSAGSREHGA